MKALDQHNRYFLYLFKSLRENTQTVKTKVFKNRTKEIIVKIFMTSANDKEKLRVKENYS